MNTKKNIVITGGLGFIGSHLCLQLLREEHNILCLDDLSTGQIRNLHDLEVYPNFKYIHWDITLPIILEQPIDEIYNLACPASPAHYQKKPVKTLLTSVLGMRNMLELARRHGCRILQASTSEVYGNPAEHPQRETYHGDVNITGPRSCYDEGKRCAETLCIDYHRQYGVPVKIIRIFNTYGPRMAPDDGRVISNFIVQALKGEPITIYGKGEQTRSFQYIDDLIEGMLRMMQTDVDFVGPINIGNPCECSIAYLARYILNQTSSNSLIVEKALPLDDPCKRCPDITFAKRNLNGWMPKVGLNEGVRKTINYFELLMQDEQQSNRCIINSKNKL